MTTRYVRTIAAQNAAAATEAAKALATHDGYRVRTLCSVRRIPNAPAPEMEWRVELAVEPKP